jgi:hypothetical protein
LGMEAPHGRATKRSLGLCLMRKAIWSPLKFLKAGENLFLGFLLFAKPDN